MSTLELIRASHEEAERYQRALAALLDAAPATPKVRTDQAHVAKHYLDQLAKCGQTLQRLYADEDGAKAAEAEALGTEPFSEFYGQLRALRESARRNGGGTVGEAQAHRLEFSPNVRFSGDERYGACVDVHEAHERFVELKRAASGKPDKFQAPDYAFYVSQLGTFDDRLWRECPREAYIEHVTSLRDYLVDFIQRSQPLFEIEQKRAEIQREFEKKHSSGEFVRWPKAAVDETRGGMDDPLYCVPCRKRFAKVTVFKAHLDGKKHRAAIERELAGKNDGPAPPKSLLALEYEVSKLVELLGPQIASTMEAVERRAASTPAEWAAELEEEEEEIALDEAGQLNSDGTRVGSENADDTDAPILAPQLTIDNYPVGWDGKPIPYWLYRLHGLGVKYKCQICGDATYWGLKNYQMHFQQWRHAQGMAALGIPNSVEFADVPLIVDAQKLWRKMQRDRKQQWNAEEDEEYEDRDGTVYSRKDFERLQRQGLLK